MEFRLVPDSEYNCDVILDPTGFLSVSPYNSNRDYGFSYIMVDDNDNEELIDWDSNHEDYNLIEIVIL